MACRRSLFAGMIYYFSGNALLMGDGDFGFTPTFLAEGYRFLYDAASQKRTKASGYLYRGYRARLLRWLSVISLMAATSAACLQAAVPCLIFHFTPRGPFRRFHAPR